MKKTIKLAPLVLKVGESYTLNNGKEITIIRKAHPLSNVLFPFYSTPFEDGTLVSAFSECGQNYVDPKLWVVSKIKH